MKYSMTHAYSSVLKDIIRGNPTINPARVRPLILTKLGWTEESATPSVTSAEKVRQKARTVKSQYKKKLGAALKAIEFFDIEGDLVC